MRYAGAYHCCRSSSSSPGLVSATTSLRRYGTAEGSISHLSRHDIAPQLRLQMRAVRRGKKTALDDVTIVCPEHERAVLNDTSVPDWGTLTLRDVRTEGQVLLCAQDASSAGRVLVDGLHVAAADLRGRELRPHGFGVDVLQGAFTLWNRQAGGELTAELIRISAGSEDRPVRGSGVFVGGQGDWQGKPQGGQVRVSRLTTGEIHADGGITPRTPDLISGGVFVVYSGVVDEVENLGSVTTYGPNDMVLDNWGTVGSWTAKAPIKSYGPSGIGFVQFAELGTLHIAAPIETFGVGRGASTSTTARCTKRASSPSRPMPTQVSAYRSAAGSASSRSIATSAPPEASATRSSRAR